MLRKNKMALALRPLSDKETRDINQYISKEDAAKDIFMSNGIEKVDANGTRARETFSLNKKDHRVMFDIIDLLYTTGELGGGGRNPDIEREITRLFGRDVFKEGPSQQFSFLRFDANGTRNFSLKNKNLVIDTGVQAKFGEDCNSVIGPFSVIDPGSRSLSGQVNLLNSAMTFDYTKDACGLLDMDGYIKSIKYENVGGDTPYQFTILFADDSEQVFNYSRTRVSTSPVVNNSKNYKRNMIVKAMFDRYHMLKGKTLEEIVQYISTRGGIQDEINGFIDDLKFQVWWKEMGDTSFPLWIQSYLGVRAGLTYANTVVGSSDWGVVYRSLVNKMACAYQTKTQTTYYPIVKGAYTHGLLEDAADRKRGREGGGARGLKRMLLTNLIANNRKVLGILRTCKAIVVSNPMFLLKSITEPGWYRYEGEYKNFRMDILRSFMRMLCNTMIQYIKPLMVAIEAELGPESKVDEGVAEFRIKVANYTLKSPFVMFASDQFTIPKYEFQFSKATVGGRGDHTFNMRCIPLLYSDKYVKAELKEPSSTQLATFMRELYGTIEPADASWNEGDVIQVHRNEEEQEAESLNEGQGTKRQKLMDGGGVTEEESEMYIDILKKNQHLPNSLLWFVNTYIPEFFPMALAYELAMNPTQAVIDSYKPVFSDSILEKTLKPFGKIVDGFIEYSEPGIKRSGSVSRSRSRSRSGSARSSSAAGKLDRTAFIHHACAILKGAKVPGKNMLFRLASGETLYKYEGAKAHDALELLWFIDGMDIAPAVIPEKDQFQLHMRALGYYQQIYDADVELCILNTRTTETPLKSIELIQIPAETARLTVGAPVPEDLKKKFIGLVQHIYDKYPDAVKAASPSLLRKKIALIKARMGKTLRKRSTSYRGMKRAAAERRLKMLTRKLHKQEATGTRAVRP